MQFRDILENRSALLNPPQLERPGNSKPELNRYSEIICSGEPGAIQEDCLGTAS